MTVRIRRSTIVDNSGQSMGGGLMVSASNVSLYDTSIVGNTGAEGGGVGAQTSNLVFSNCSLTGNLCTNDGSANLHAGAISVANSVIKLGALRLVVFAFARRGKGRGVVPSPGRNKGGFLFCACIAGCHNANLKGVVV